MTDSHTGFSVLPTLSKIIWPDRAKYSAAEEKNLAPMYK